MSNARDPNTSLLDWATKAALEHPAPVGTVFRKPEQIDKKWIDALLGEKTDGSRMKQEVAKLKDPNSTHEERIEALSQLEFLCDLTHNANDMTQIGGLELLFEYILSDNEEIRLAAFNILGVCVANNDYFSDAVMQNPDRFSQLLQLFQQPASEVVRSKSLWIISGLLRVSSIAFSNFTSNPDAMSSLIHCLVDFSNLRVTRRAINLMQFIEFKMPHLLGKGINRIARGVINSKDKNIVDFPELLLASLEQIKDTDCREQIVKLLAEFHERGDNLSDETPNVLRKVQDEVERCNNDDSHDPEMLISSITELLKVTEGSKDAT